MTTNNSRAQRVMPGGHGAINRRGRTARPANYRAKESLDYIDACAHGVIIKNELINANADRSVPAKIAYERSER